MRGASCRAWGPLVVAALALSGAAHAAASGPSASPGGASTPAALRATNVPGSIVYIKKHNVWLTDSDGSTHVQVTTNGTARDPWQSPTQSDSGVIVAHRSGLVYRMNQRGQIIGRFDPPDLYDTLGHTMSGRDLTEVAVSPNGKMIAYTYFKLWGGTKRWTTGFTRSSSVTDPDKYGLSFYDKPSWVTGSRVVLNAWYRNKAHLYDVGVRDIAWFDERFYTSSPKELSDLEVSRDGQWTVGVRGDVGDQSIVVIRNEGDVLTSATPWTPVFGVTNPCNIGYADGNLVEPTIAPDGSSVAWAEPDGVYRSSDMLCNESTRVDLLVAAGGSDPHWSAARIGQTPEVTEKVAMVAAPTLRGSHRVGARLRVNPGTWKPRPGTVKVTWLRDGKPVSGAKARSYRLRPGDKGHRIAARVTVSKAGWKSASATTAAISVRR